MGRSIVQTSPKFEAPNGIKIYVNKILISRDRAVCLQFGAKIQNNWTTTTFRLKSESFVDDQSPTKIYVLP